MPLAALLVQSRRSRNALLFALGIFSLWAGSYAVAPPAGEGPAFDSVYVGFTVVALVLFVRAWRGGVVLQGDRLIIRNLLTTIRLRRCEVRHVELAPIPVLGGVRGLRIVTKAGRVRSCSNLSLGFRPAQREEVESALAQLSTWLGTS